MNIIQRLRNTVTKAFGPVANVPADWPTNWFQTAHDLTNRGTGGNSVVEACVAAYAQTIAQLPLNHVKIAKNGTKTKVRNSNVQKLLNRPNTEQTRSDLILNLIYGLLYNGNGYIVGDAESPDQFTEIFLLDPRTTRPQRVQPTRDVFYTTGGAYAEAFGAQGQVMIPEQAIAHFKLFAPNDPLIGVTSLTHAAPAIAAHGAITQHQAAFFTNMARPSGALSTDLTLKKEQIETLREAWLSHSKGLNSGEVPILTSGLKWTPFQMTSQDAELVSAWRMTTEEISRVFRVPPMLINNMENATFNNAEALMRFWLASGLGFLIDHIELVLNDFFDLPDGEQIDADTKALLRTDYAGQVAGLNSAVAGGIMAINEGRAELGLAPVEGGEVPRIQSQYVPIDEVRPPEPPAPPTPVIAPPPEGDDEIDDPDEDTQNAAKLLAQSWFITHGRNAA